MRLKFFIDPSRPRAWRGPERTKRIWGEPASGAWNPQSLRTGHTIGQAGPADRSAGLGHRAERLGGDAADGREEELQAIQGGPGE